MKSQREIFLESEADAWYRRNRDGASIHAPHPTSWTLRLPTIIASLETDHVPTLLEIGASDGAQIRAVELAHDIVCHGIEPSKAAVDAATKLGTSVVRGTADDLPFDDDAFDIVVFGFCLYVCDPTDYGRIAREADRVLRAPGYVVIQDFYSPVRRSVPYAHVGGVSTTKMDFRELFSWSPEYACVDHAIRGHETGLYSDDPDEWVMTSVLKKRRRMT